MEFFLKDEKLGKGNGRATEGEGKVSGNVEMLGENQYRSDSETTGVVTIAGG